MKHVFCLVFIIAGLIGCDTPKVGFQYDSVKTLVVGANEYKVYSNATQAQSIRLNNVGLRQRQEGADGALVAIELATGCSIRRVDKRTDAVLVIARIKC